MEWYTFGNEFRGNQVGGPDSALKAMWGSPQTFLIDNEGRLYKVDEEKGLMICVEADEDDSIDQSLNDLDICVVWVSYSPSVLEDNPFLKGTYYLFKKPTKLPKLGVKEGKKLSERLEKAIGKFCEHRDDIKELIGALVEYADAKYEHQEEVEE